RRLRSTRTGGAVHVRGTGPGSARLLRGPRSRIRGRLRPTQGVKGANRPMKTARGKRLHEASLQWMRREAATDKAGGNPQHWWEPWPEDDSGRSTDWDTATRVRMHCCMTQQQVIKSAVEVIAASSPWFIRPRLEATAMERLDPVGLV